MILKAEQNDNVSKDDEEVEDDFEEDIEDDIEEDTEDDVDFSYSRTMVWIDFILISTHKNRPKIELKIIFFFHFPEYIKIGTYNTNIVNITIIQFTIIYRESFVAQHINIHISKFHAKYK